MWFNFSTFQKKTLIFSGQFLKYVFISTEYHNFAVFHIRKQTTQNGKYLIDKEGVFDYVH